jgi:porphobilinogen deaminase
VLGLQIREVDAELWRIVNQLNVADVAARIAVERRILNLFEGGCQLPLGAYCQLVHGILSVKACVANAWDAPVRYSENFGTDVEQLAQKTVLDLRA